MRARILAVQRALWMLTAAALLLCLLAFPRGRNREYRAALDELTAFQTAFHRDELEKSLLDYARAQGLVTLSEVRAAIVGPGVPKVHVAHDAAPIAPLARASLRTLGEALERSSAESSIDIALARPADIGAAVAWRLSREAPGEDYQLASVVLAQVEPSEAEVAREAEVALARLALLAAEREFEAASKKLDAAEGLYDARRRWKAPWKAMLKADQARQEARVLVRSVRAELERKRARYETLAKQALGVKSQGQGEGAGGSYERGLAEVTLKASSGKTLAQRIPVALEVRQARVPMLSGTAFTATRAAGLWDEVQGGDAGAAIQEVRSRFTWHYQYVDLFGVAVGGMTILQFLPLVLPFSLLVLLLRMREVSASYNPFGAVEEQGGLPRVGMRLRAFELVSIVLLPLIATLLAVVSLGAIAVVPVVPLVCAFAVLGLGLYAFFELGALEALLEAVGRSRSNPPPDGGGLG